MNANKATDAQNPANGAQAASGSTQSGSNGINRSGRARLMVLLLLLFGLSGAAWVCYWFLFLRFSESTDDAYVAGNQVRISSQVSGTVTDIFIDNNDAVTAGQILLRLDPADAELALNRARAALADAVRQTSSLMAESERLTSVVALRKKELEKAQGDYKRRRDRKTAMAVSEEELSHARDNLAIAEVALRVAEDDMRRNHLLLQGTPLAEQPLVRQHAHQTREAWLTLKRCEIKSPVDGYAARRTVQIGMHVAPGVPLLAVIPLTEVWVDANFKEVQLTDMRIGQPARVTADIYGGNRIYSGTVAGFSAGTGSSFSLLPPENATGNWIKVVQRVPVKIVLAKEALKESPLLVGLSCTATVDVKAAQGPMLATTATPEAPLFSTSVFAYNMTEIDGEIERIIRNNADGKQ